MNNKNYIQDLLDRAQKYRECNLTPHPPAKSRLTPAEKEENRKAFDELIEKIYKPYRK